jgi:hypothetical protein
VSILLGKEIPMKLLSYIFIFSFIFLGTSNAGPCSLVDKPPSSFNGALPTAGEYEIRFIADQGSKSGSEVIGTLWLWLTRPNDVSFKTGEYPKDIDGLPSPPLYGAIDFDYKAIGAPIDTNDKVAPNPSSKDPIYPGVLVHIIDWMDGYPVDTPVLTIGSLSNLRNGSMYLDGPGICLILHQLDKTGFSGIWTNWGIMIDGSGYFCATLKK